MLPPPQNDFCWWTQSRVFAQGSSISDMMIGGNNYFRSTTIGQAVPASMNAMVIHLLVRLRLQDFQHIHFLPVMWLPSKSLT